MSFAADTSAMPAPIKPAPRTPIVSTRIAGSPNGFFLHSVEPKKSPRSAADSDVVARCEKSSRSTLEPSACPPSSPARALARIAGGAGYFPLACFSTCFEAWLNMRRRPGAVFSRNQSVQPTLRLRGLMVPSAAWSAVAIAVRSSAFGSHTVSTSPSFLALSALTCLPVSIRSRAGLAPMSFGSRCVPPAPGSKPSITSGRPSTVFEDVVATRCAHESAISSPPPRHAPSIAATHGFFFCSASRRSMHSWPFSPTSATASFDEAPSRSIILMFAPAMKEPGFAEISTAAFTFGSLSMALVIVSNSPIISSESEFCFSPVQSSFTSATPDSVMLIDTFDT
mmetsp:Transcript_37338/g.87329  ORF Transcript_37338/g.87329 Transcript_37338/m.87329 type:complete len:339 (-) Transcript_37338:70-1086(-)